MPDRKPERSEVLAPVAGSLCCSTFVTNFVSVSTHSARVQEVALNPQKLAGQCGKLKCCLNYELAGYEDARKNFPDTGTPLKTSQGDAYHLKTDVYRNIMWFGYEGGGAQALVPVPVERVIEIRELNKKGQVPDELIEISMSPSSRASGVYRWSWRGKPYPI